MKTPRLSRRSFLRAASFTGAATLLRPQLLQAQDATPYAPVERDEVVIYTHHFLPERFEAAKQIVAEGFTVAQNDMGQSRHNYFLEDPANHSIVVVSFYQAGESVDEWHDFAGRLETLDKLEPLRSEPMTVERYTVYAITNTDSD